MGNYRGMMAGLGEAMVTVGKMGLADSIDQQKEARLEKIRLESEKRSQDWQLQSEVRADDRAKAGEARAEDRAKGAEAREEARRAKERAAEHQNRLKELSHKAKLDREEMAEKARLEKEIESLKSRYKVITTDGTFDQPGGVFIYNENDPQDISKVDTASNLVVPVGSSREQAKPPIPFEAENLARKLAEQEADGRAKWGSTDSTDFAPWGGDRKLAVEALTKKHMPAALKEMGYKPSDYGYSDGMISAVENAPASPAGNKVAPTQSVDSSPIPGVPADLYRFAFNNLKAAGRPTDPETIRAYLAFKQRQQQNGGNQ